MRTAVISTSYPLHEGQAAGHFVQAEVEQLCRQGQEVVVIAPGPRASDAGTAPRVVRVAGRGAFGPPGVWARLKQQPLRGWGCLEFVWRARQRLRHLGPFDKVIAHWLLPSAWPIASGYAGELEAVAHGSDVRLLSALPARLRGHIAAGWMRRNIRVRCVSAELYEALISLTTPALRTYLRLEPMPLRIDESICREAARQRLRIAPGEQLAVLVARLVPEKRVRTALEAIADLPGVRVVVVGGGPLLPSLQRRFPGVHFTGELPRPQALDWIAAADVLVSASMREGAPTAVREARALGVPVVACPAGDLRAWAEHDSAVWLV